MTGLLRGTTGLVLLAVAITGCGSTAPTKPDQTIHRYVALGDGFTASPNSAGTDRSGPCLRSPDNYPAQVAKALHVATWVDVSCTGASTTALTNATRAGKGKPEVPAQLDALTDKTDLVTLGVGINDSDLLHAVFSLCLTYPCGTKIPAETLLSDVTKYGATLTTTVRTIQAKAPQADILLVGYPRIVPTEGTCRDLPALSQVELDAANYLLDQVNRQMQSSARETGSVYVDVATPSTGHEVCSGDPWVTGSSDKSGASVAFHPVAAEQRAVAKQIEQLLAAR